MPFAFDESSAEWILARNAKLAETSTLERSINMCSNEFKGKPPLSFSFGVVWNPVRRGLCRECAAISTTRKNSSSSNSFDVSDKVNA